MLRNRDEPSRVRDSSDRGRAVFEGRYGAAVVVVIAALFAFGALVSIA